MKGGDAAAALFSGSGIDVNSSFRKSILSKGFVLRDALLALAIIRAAEEAAEKEGRGIETRREASLRG